MGRMILLVAVLAGLLTTPAWSVAEEPAAVFKGIRVIRSGSDLGVEISADRDIVYTCYKMPQLRRVIVDLPKTEPGRPDTVYKVDSTLIPTIRLERKSINDVTITRISLNLTEDVDVTDWLDQSDKKKLTVLLKKPVTGSAVTPVAAPAAELPAEPAAAKPERSEAEQPPTASKTRPTREAPAPRPVLQPVVPAPAETVPAARGPVTVSGVKFRIDAIEIQTGGAGGDYRAFTLRDPGRLVIDIPGARSALRSIEVPSNGFGVVAARIAASGGKLRLVFDTGAKPFPAYRVEKTETGLRVTMR